MNHPTRESGHDVDRKHLRILVADDDDLIRNLIVRILTRAGHEARATATGVEALAQLSSDTFDLAIIDIRMPDHGAVDIAGKLRDAACKRPPIIALTADATTETGIDCQRAGIELRLIKPVPAQDLLAAVDTLANGVAPPNRLNVQTPAIDAPLDEAIVAQLGKSTGERSHVLRAFMAQATELIGAIELALQEKDARRVGALAHKLEGCAGIVGAALVHRTCRERNQMTDADWLARLKQCGLTLEQILRDKSYL